MNTILKQVLDLSDSQEEINKFVKNRLLQLGESKLRKLRVADTIRNPIVTDFFDEKMELFPSPPGAESANGSVVIDDLSIYDLAVRLYRQEHSKELNSYEYYAEEYSDEYKAIKTANNVILQYCGDPLELDDSSEEKWNNTFLLSSARNSIADLRKFALCYGRSAIAHDILCFLGVENYFVTGLLLKKIHPNPNGATPHAFVLVKLGKIYHVFDPMIPVRIFEKVGDEDVMPIMIPMHRNTHLDKIPDDDFECEYTYCSIHTYFDSPLSMEGRQRTIKEEELVYIIRFILKTNPLAELYLDLFEEQ